MENAVRKQIKDAGYSDRQISNGFKYAKEQGYNNANELGSLVMSRILYSDSQLKRGTLFEFRINSK